MNSKSIILEHNEHTAYQKQNVYVLFGFKVIYKDHCKEEENGRILSVWTKLEDARQAMRRFKKTGRSRKNTKKDH